MRIAMAAKAVVVWAVILVWAVANGALREALLVPRLGTAPGFVLSGLLLAGVIVGAAYVALPWLGARGGLLWLVGGGWLVLTLIFEFSFGLVRGQSLADILRAYTFQEGNLWPLVLVVTAAAPWLAARIRGWRSSR